MKGGPGLSPVEGQMIGSRHFYIPDLVPGTSQL